MKNKELLAEMKRADKTQQQMADAIGISTGTFSKKVNGQRDFTLSEVKAIKRVLGIDDHRMLAIFFDYEV